MSILKLSLSTTTASTAATLSASCCVLPMALLGLGFTSLGPFALLMRYRPLTLSFSILMLAAAFYLVYRPQAAADCEAGTCSPEALRRRRRIVWLSALLMAVFVALSLVPVTMSMTR